MKDFMHDVINLIEKSDLKCSVEHTDKGILLVPSKKRWRGKHLEDYFYVCDTGEVHVCKETFHKLDDFRYITHNYFESRYRAEEALKIQTLKGEVKHYLLELEEEGYMTKSVFFDQEVAKKVAKKFGTTNYYLL